MKNALLLVVAVLAGCASVDCESDWFAIGQRDGRLGAHPQADRYAGSCPGKVDATRYSEGWADGFDQRPRIIAF